MRWLQAPVAVPLVPLELQLSVVNILCSPPFTRITHEEFFTNLTVIIVLSSSPLVLQLLPCRLAKANSAHPPLAHRH